MEQATRKFLDTVNERSKSIKRLGWKISQFDNITKDFDELSCIKVLGELTGLKETWRELVTQYKELVKEKSEIYNQLEKSLNDVQQQADAIDKYFNPDE